MAVAFKIQRYYQGDDGEMVPIDRADLGDWMRVEDFERVFEPGLAYMPVPRCDQCRWWRERGDISSHGDCSLFSTDGVVRKIHRIDRRAVLVDEHGDNADTGELLTAANFGCVQWKQKP